LPFLAHSHADRAKLGVPWRYYRSIPANEDFITALTWNDLATIHCFKNCKIAALPPSDTT